MCVCTFAINMLCAMFGQFCSSATLAKSLKDLEFSRSTIAKSWRRAVTDPWLTPIKKN